MEIQMHLSPWSRGHHHSQWLHTTLSDLDMKMKTMINLIQENADYGPESYHKGKPKLMQMLEELDRSYRFLAEEHDQLRSKSIQFQAPDISSSPCKFRRVKSKEENPKMDNFYQDPELEIIDSHPESVVEDPDSEFGSTNLDHEYLDKIADELNMDFNKNIIADDNHTVKTCEANVGDIGTESNWSELKFQVTKLMEENIRQQAELLRRNAEKRETIKELRSRLERLKAENRDLRSCLGCLRLDVKQNHNHNHKSRLKGQFPLKFLGCS